jgi:ABC transport system ATP-binding/permease protein
MNLLSVENLSKMVGVRQLFKDLSFGIAEGEKVALVARNGTGKTTLLKILAGKDTADSGKVVFRRDIKIGYLPQDPIFEPGMLVIDALMNDDSYEARLLNAYERALEGNGKAMFEGKETELGDLSRKIDLANAWDFETRMKQVAGKLALHEMSQPVDSLSGGQKKRLALAKVLVHQPDLLIMDEPTNHLDIEMIEWLEGYLEQQITSLLMVTHDRYFLEDVCNVIWEMDDKSLYTYKGNYSFFIEKKAEREFNMQRETEKAKSLYKTELEWLRRMPKARGTKSKARIDAAGDLKEKAANRAKVQEMELKVKMTRIGGKILEMKKVTKAYGDLQIMKGFDYTFRKGEKIGIVGKNGIGKSTFLNIVTGKEQPDSGKVNVGDTIVFGYYTQNGLEIKEDKRVIELVREQIADVIATPDGRKMNAREFLELFQFNNDQQHTYISKLSGGERRRLHLLTVLVKNPNFLILDEPTNDLDLMTLNVLEDFIEQFQGCVIMVSHDRYFMDKLVDHLFVFEGDGVIKDFTGNYATYMAQKRENEAREKQQLREEQQKVQAQGKPNTSNAPKLSFKEKFEYEQLEKEIVSLEEEKEKTEAALHNPDGSVEELTKLSLRFTEIEKMLLAKTTRWFELAEKVG